MSTELENQSKILQVMQEVGDMLSSKVDAAKTTLESVVGCIDDGDLFQAAVRLESLGFKFTEIEWKTFEIFSREESE